jgi:hypothetical protein
MIAMPEGEQTCFPAGSDGEEITSFAWSPDSNYIAFTSGSHKTKEGELRILTLSNGDIQRILTDIQNPISIYWR